MTQPDSLSTALVLGGGGITGIAWEIGLLFGLSEGGADVTDADLIVGTSAGANVGAQITSGLSLAALYARQLRPLAETKETMAEIDPEALMALFSGVMGASDAQSARAAVGAAALAAPTMSERERWETIADRLPVHEWSERRLKIVVVDARTGEWRQFDRHSRVSLVDAVAASGAVPGIYPPATIGDRRYIDGGVRSGTNADFAAGNDRVLIVRAETSEMLVDGRNPLGLSFAQELAALHQSGAQTLVIEPDEVSAGARGPNPLDPSRREASANAGRAQGREWAERVGSFWQANR